jgi:hypothetical protein
VSQDVCSWNVRLFKELPNDSPYRPRDVLARKDVRTLAREMLGTAREAFSRAFRARRRSARDARTEAAGRKRDAAVVLGNVGTLEDVPVLEPALDGEERRANASSSRRRATAVHGRPVCRR